MVGEDVINYGSGGGVINYGSGCREGVINYGSGWRGGGNKLWQCLEGV